MKRNPSATQAPLQISPEAEIRDYAYHLYEQSGRREGHDLDNWLEAKACLAANIPRRHSHSRLHRHVRGLGPAQQEELCTLSLEAKNLAM